jgi:hypothetical protein
MADQQKDIKEDNTMPRTNCHSCEVRVVKHHYGAVRKPCGLRFVSPLFLPRGVAPLFRDLCYFSVIGLSAGIVV